ncbi:MAG: hypothetical protein U9N84_02010 [Actinomycetota bacterium]|nr:hypothetical protein [Actinomycetota bacterium]
MDIAIPVLMIVMGIGIAGVWTRDIVAGTYADVREGILTARDPDSGGLFWPHWVAEYSTAVILVISAVGLLADTTWSTTLAAIGAGALFYTSTNSLGWSLARPDRRPYAVPMIIGVAVAFVTSIYLLI